MNFEEGSLDDDGSLVASDWKTLSFSQRDWMASSLARRASRLAVPFVAVADADALGSASALASAMERSDIAGVGIDVDAILSCTVLYCTVMACDRIVKCMGLIVLQLSGVYQESSMMLFQLLLAWLLLALRVLYYFVKKISVFRSLHAY